MSLNNKTQYDVIRQRQGAGPFPVVHVMGRPYVQLISLFLYFQLDATNEISN